MEPTKYDIAKDSGVGNQQALVKKKLRSPKGLSRFTIPGGKSMMDPEEGSITTKEELTAAIYNWLRHTRFFLEVRLGFAKEPDKLKTRAIKMQEFDATPDGSPIWQVHPGRKYYLAEMIADAVYNNKHVVAIDVDKKGITAIVDSTNTFSDKSENFEPYVEFLPNYKAKGEYAIHRK